MAWFWWAGAAVLLGLAELHAPGLYFIWIALGGGVAAMAAGLGMAALEWQLGVFMAASIAWSALGWVVYHHLGRLPAPGRLNERGAQMLGAHGVVAEAIGPGGGKVRVGDTVWLAEGPLLDVGTAVRVRAVHGARLEVEAA